MQDDDAASSWSDLADRYLEPRRALQQRCCRSARLRPLDPQAERITRDNLRVSVLEDKFVPPAVCNQCLDWPLYAVDMGHADDATSSSSGRPRLTVMCPPGASALRTETDRVRSTLLPLLLTFTELLNDPVVTTSHPTALPWTTYKHPPSVLFIAVRAPKRHLPLDAGAAIIPDHINGGMTIHTRPTDTRAPPMHSIVVYRCEDAGKVLVHELVHYYCIDGLLWPATSSEVAAVEAAIARRHGVALCPPVRRLGINEAFTETLACYLHARWYTTFARSRSQSQSQSRTLPRTLTRATPRRRVDVMAASRRHFDTIAARLLNHFGRGLQQQQQQEEQQQLFLDGTHAYSYVIGKAAMWRDIDAFLVAFPPTTRPTVDRFAEFLDAAISSMLLVSLLRRLRIKWTKELVAALVTACVSSLILGAYKLANPDRRAEQYYMAQHTGAYRVMQACYLIIVVSIAFNLRFVVSELAGGATDAAKQRLKQWLRSLKKT